MSPVTAGASARGLRQHDFGAITQLIRAVDDDGLSAGQSFGDGDHVACRGTGNDLSHAHGIIRIDEVHIAALGAVHQRRAGHDDLIVQRLQNQVSIDELIRKQLELGIVVHARSLSVPVVVSIWLSELLSVPLAI